MRNKDIGTVTSKISCIKKYDVKQNFDPYENNKIHVNNTKIWRSLVSKEIKKTQWAPLKKEAKTK